MSGEEPGPDGGARGAETTPTGAGPSPVGRLAIAGGAAALFAIVIVIVVALGGSGGGDAAPAEAPSECLRAWNADPASTSFGTHNYSFGHDYRQARVSYRSAPELSESDDGECTVVFARLSLDQEPFAAGQILEGNKWESLSEIEGVDLNRVSELQGEALASPNASLLPDGRLAP